MSGRRTPPPSPRRLLSSGASSHHVPPMPSRLRTTIASSPEDEGDTPRAESDHQGNPNGRFPTAFWHSETSSPVTAEPEPLKEDGDDVAQGTIIEPTYREEDERTALLEAYHHNRVCGLRNCNHGTFSPRASSIISVGNESMSGSGFLRDPNAVNEHDQPRDFAHAILGDPIADALMGTKTSNTRKSLKRKYGLKNTRFMYLTYYFPFLRWITQYKLLWLRGDFIAALTMASFYVPMSLSYATNLAHIPAINGLYAFIFHPLIYAFLGSCPQMSVGPEAPGSLLVGTVVATCVKNGHAHDSDDAVNSQIAGVVTTTAGLIIFVAGLGRLGFLDSILSKPFLRGFISSIGIVIFVDQSIPELGLQQYVKEAGVAQGSPVAKFIFVIKNITKSHKLTAIVSWSAFVVIMVLRELKNRLQPRYPSVAYIPDRFLVVVISTILAWRLNWGDQGLELLGHIKPPGDDILSFHWPFQFQHMQHIDTALSTSFVIALLGFFESSVAARSIGDGSSGIKGMDVSPNRELVALGTANLIGGCFMSLPAFGGYGRSKVLVSTGGTTPMAGVLLAFFALISVLFLLPWFYYMPKGVLSAMISVVAYSLVEEAPHDIKFFIQIRGWNELAMMAVVCIATIFYSLNLGIALGMGLSLVKIVRHATKPRIQILGRVHGTPDKFENAEDFVDNDIEDIAGSLIIKIPEPLTFANTGALKNRLRRFEKYGTGKAHPSLPRVRAEESNRNVIFDIHGVTSIDGAGTQVLTEIVEAYMKKGVRVVFCRLPRKKSEVFEAFQKAGIVEMCGGRRHFVDSIDEALKVAEAEDLDDYFRLNGHPTP